MSEAPAHAGACAIIAFACRPRRIAVVVQIRTKVQVQILDEFVFDHRLCIHADSARVAQPGVGKDVHAEIGCFKAKYSKIAPVIASALLNVGVPLVW